LDRFVYQNLLFFLTKKIRTSILSIVGKLLRGNTKAYCDDKGVKEFGAFLFLDLLITLIRLGGNLIKVDRVDNLGLYPILNAVKVHLDRKSRQKWVKILFAALFFLLFSAFLVYLPYNCCIETDFPSSELRFENLEQNHLLADELNKSGITKSSLLPAILEGIYFGKLLSSFQKSPYVQEPVILRC